MVSPLSQWLARLRALARPARRPRPAADPSQRRAELAIDYYLVRSDDYARAVTRASEREARAFLATGAPARALRGDFAWTKWDHTAFTLVGYRGRLRELAKLGMYHGPTELKRLCADGSWEPLRLPIDEP